MRDDQFRAFLTACGYTSNSIASRLSRCRAVERHLRIDLDDADIDASGVGQFRLRLEEIGVGGAVLANQLNAVRTYARFRDDIPRLPPAAGPSSTLRPQARDPASVMPTSLEVCSTLDLLALRGRIDDELRDRGVVRTGNGPVGDYAEALFAHTFGWTLEVNSAAGHDAVDAAKIRYQIKARREGRSAGVRQLSAIRRLHDRDFDWLAAVILNSGFGVRRALLMPHALVAALAKRVELTNSWRLMLSDRVWTIPGVRDVTAQLIEAQKTLPDRRSFDDG